MPASRHVLKKSRTPRLIGPLLATSLTSLLIACASPGPPRPPSLHLTEVPNDLTAQRVGDRVLLHWTTPSRTIDGFTAPTPLTAEICREPNPQPSKPVSTAACPVILHLSVNPGPSDAADPLPAALTTDPASVLAYRVRILNPEGRSAGLSKPALAPAGATPPPVTGLHAISTRNGILVEWQPLSSPSLVELDRTLISPTPSRPQPKKSTSPLSAPAESTEARLHTSSTEINASDPGGTLDRTTQRGETYTYRVQRLRIVTLNGHTLELRSDPSSPITINLSDTFPPATPTGLAAIPSNNGVAATIDLSWQPNNDPDLAGYNVYRRTNGNFERITPQPTLGPAFSDTAVTTGTAYTYRVTAVDNTGNESPPSTEVTETARPASNP